MEKVKKAIDRMINCELKDVWVESTANARLPTWISTFECACKVFLEKWKREGKFHTQRGWHHPKGSWDQMKGECKPIPLLPVFLFPDHGSSVTGPIAHITTMLFSQGGPCPLKNPFSLKTTFAWNFVTETRNIINTKLKAQTQHPVIFSILWALIHWLWFLMGIIQDCVIGQLTLKRNMCIYSFDFMFTRDKCSLVKTVLCKNHHPQTVSMTSDPPRTAQISKKPSFLLWHHPAQALMTDAII